MDKKTNNTQPATPVVAPSSTQPVVAAPAAQNDMAIASMVVGIVSLIFCWAAFFGLVAGVTALVLGILGLKKPIGKGMAITGIVTGGLSILINIIFVIIWIIAVALVTSTPSYLLF